MKYSFQEWNIEAKNKIKFPCNEFINSPLIGTLELFRMLTRTWVFQNDKQIPLICMSARRAPDKERFPFVWKNRLFRWEIKWNGPFHWKFFGKKGIPSEVFLFSRFSRNDRKISVPFATTSLFAHRARSTSDPKNAETYPLNQFKLIQNSCRV